MENKEDQPYHYLRSRGVLTVDDLIAKLQALPERTRKMPVLMPSDKDWSYISGVGEPEGVEEYSWPTLVESEVGWSPIDL